MPNSTAQAQDEARRKLADRSGMIAESVRAVLAQRRHALDLSLQQVADRSGLTKAHVWEVERGRSRNVSVSTIVGLAAGLNITEAELLGLAALRADPARGAEEMRERAAQAAERFIRSVDENRDDWVGRPIRIALAAAIRALPASDEGGGE